MWRSSQTMGSNFGSSIICIKFMKNQSTGKCPFEIVYTKPPVQLQTSVNFHPLLILVAKAGKWQKKLFDFIKKSNQTPNRPTTYKRKQLMNTGVHLQTFQEGDLVMIHLRFLAGTYHKLKNKNLGRMHTTQNYHQIFTSIPSSM